MFYILLCDLYVILYHLLITRLIVHYMLLRVVYSQHTEVGSFSAIWLHVTLLWFLGGHIPHSTKTGFINFYVSGELFLYNCII